MIKLTKLQKMGCAKSKIPESQTNSIKMIPIKYEGIGLLKATIQPVIEMTNHQIFFSQNQNILQIEVCNQIFKTQLTYVTNTRDQLNPAKKQFEFAINQKDAQKCLSVKISTPSEFGKLSKVAQGKEVLRESFFIQKNDEESYKESHNIYLTSEKDVRIGWVRFSLQFIPQKYDILMSRVNSVTLRNQSKQGRSVYVNLQIGGQQFQSESQKSTEKRIPQWQNALHYFVVPKFLSYGKLSVYAKNQQQGFDYLVGELKFDLRIILESDQLQTFSEPITKRGKITGSVCIQFLKTKDMIPQIQKIQRPKRIKFVQQIPLQKILQYARQAVNFIDKKSSQATVSTSNTSFDKIFQNKLNKKLQQLRNSNVSIPLVTANQYCKQNKGQMFHSQSRNEFQIDRQQRGCGYIRGQNPQYIFQRTLGQRVLSYIQLSFQLNIPQTSSKLINNSSRKVQKDADSRECRLQRKSSVNSRKQGSIKIGRNSSVYNKGCKAKINAFQVQDQTMIQKIQHHLKQRSKAVVKEKMNQKMNPNNIQFDSLPDEISSKSVCLKNESIIQTFSQNKSQIFSSSLKEKTNSGSENHDHFSIEIKAMQDRKKQILQEQRQMKSFSKKKDIKNIQQILNEQSSIEIQDQNSWQTKNNNFYDHFQIKISSIIAKKKITSNS